ncbi:IS3 family transposase [Orbus wheelerorum]
MSHTLKTKCIYQYKLENITQAKSMIPTYIEAYFNRVRKDNLII